MEAAAPPSFIVRCGFLGSGSISLVTVSSGGPDGAGGTRLAVLHPEFGIQQWSPVRRAHWETKTSISLAVEEGSEGRSSGANTTFCCKFVSFPEGSQEACGSLFLSTDQGGAEERGWGGPGGTPGLQPPVWYAPLSVPRAPCPDASSHAAGRPGRDLWGVGGPPLWLCLPPPPPASAEALVRPNPRRARSKPPAAAGPPPAPPLTRSLCQVCQQGPDAPRQPPTPGASKGEDWGAERPQPGEGRIWEAKPDLGLLPRHPCRRPVKSPWSLCARPARPSPPAATARPLWTWCSRPSRWPAGRPCPPRPATASSPWRTDFMLRPERGLSKLAPTSSPSRTLWGTGPRRGI